MVSCWSWTLWRFIKCTILYIDFSCKLWLFMVSKTHLWLIKLHFSKNYEKLILWNYTLKIACIIFCLLWLRQLLSWKPICLYNLCVPEVEYRYTSYILILSSCFGMFHSEAHNPFIVPRKRKYKGNVLKLTATTQGLNASSTAWTSSTNCSATTIVYPQPRKCWKSLCH